MEHAAARDGENPAQGIASEGKVRGVGDGPGGGCGFDGGKRVVLLLLGGLLLKGQALFERRMFRAPHVSNS